MATITFSDPTILSYDSDTEFGTIPEFLGYTQRTSIEGHEVIVTTKLYIGEGLVQDTATIEFSTDGRTTGLTWFQNPVAAMRHIVEIIKRQVCGMMRFGIFKFKMEPTGRSKLRTYAHFFLREGVQTQIRFGELHFQLNHSSCDHVQ